MSKGFSISGLNHLGLIVEDIQLAKQWFLDTLGLTLIEDRGQMFFMLAGKDVLAVKTPDMAVSKPEHGLEQNWSEPREGWQTLDHYGFYAQNPTEVDRFAAFIAKHGATILKGPYDRKDGRSVYFRDPCGNVGEYLFFNADVYM